MKKLADLNLQVADFLLGFAHFTEVRVPKVQRVVPLCCSSMFSTSSTTPE